MIPYVQSDFCIFTDLPRLATLATTDQQENLTGEKPTNQEA